MTSVFSGKTLAVTLGGAAAERSISLESGENVALALEQAGARVLRIDPAEPGWQSLLGQASFAFNLLHGPGGEDGSIQGLFESMKVPYSVVAGRRSAHAALFLSRRKVRLVGCYGRPRYGFC